MGIATLKDIIDPKERECFFFIKMCNRWYYDQVFKPWFQRLSAGLTNYVKKGGVLSKQEKEMLEAVNKATPILNELEQREEFKKASENGY